MSTLPHKIAVVHSNKNKQTLNAFMRTQHTCSHHQLQPVSVGSNMRGQRFKAIILLSDVDTSNGAANNWFAEFTRTCITKGDM